MKENNQKAELKGYIREIFPDTTYQEKTYGYNVEVELLDKTSISISDLDMFSKEEFKNQLMTFEIFVAIKGNLINCVESSYTITPSPGKGDPHGSFCGIIEEIREPTSMEHFNNWRDCIVNIGIGSLYVRIYKDWKEDFNQFKVGDCICVENGRLDLKGIH